MDIIIIARARACIPKLSTEPGRGDYDRMLVAKPSDPEPRLRERLASGPDRRMGPQALPATARQWWRGWQAGSGCWRRRGTFSHPPRLGLEVRRAGDGYTLGRKNGQYGAAGAGRLRQKRARAREKASERRCYLSIVPLTLFSPERGAEQTDYTGRSGTGQGWGAEHPSAHTHTYKSALLCTHWTLVALAARAERLGWGLVRIKHPGSGCGWGGGDSWNGI